LGSTHNINTPVSRNSDHGVEGTEIDTDDAHLCFFSFPAVEFRVESVSKMRLVRKKKTMKIKSSLFLSRFVSMCLTLGRVVWEYAEKNSRCPRELCQAKGG
jgi:hypothetical protein